MPLFASKPAGDAADWEPPAADGRLAHTAGADPSGVFTSDLPVSEYVLLGEAGFEPLGFVVRRRDRSCDLDCTETRVAF